MQTQNSTNNNNNSNNSSWINQDKPLVIAGPCSAESLEQVMDTARELARDGRTDYFRAGIWKPRTSPGSFQGIGAEGLDWLKQVRAETGMPVTTEVGSEKHVEEALNAGIDMLWIGARTVSNPFVMQGIAESLKGTDIPILVKNPLSPDIDLWEGAIKRLAHCGITKLGAIHRGFSWWSKSQFRNQPFWHIPLELKRRMPDLPIIGDPSHMGGKRSLISLLASRALEHKFSGLMIEVHPDPDKAWSDSAQQLTPTAFAQVMNELSGIKQILDPNAVLEELRAEIDTMDDMLIWALSARMDLSGKIARIKQSAQIPTIQIKRWEEVLKRVKALGDQSGLNTAFVELMFNTIHEESIAVQESLKKSNDTEIKKEPNFAH